MNVCNILETFRLAAISKVEKCQRVKVIDFDVKETSAAQGFFPERQKLSNLVIHYINKNLASRISFLYGNIILMGKQIQFFSCKRAYFIKRTQTRTRAFRKSGSQTFRKSGPYTKIHCMS